jgi:hypothetical protein
MPAGEPVEVSKPSLRKWPAAKAIPWLADRWISDNHHVVAVMVSPHDEVGPLRLGRLGAEFTVTATDPTINPSYWARRLAAEWERWERDRPGSIMSLRRGPATRSSRRQGNSSQQWAQSACREGENEG